MFKNLCKRLRVENITNIEKIRSDHGRELKNSLFSEFCNKHCIVHESFAPKTPQQNGGLERKN